MEVAVDRSDASALADLQMHWDEAYTIGLDGDIWLARFHGSSDELRAHTSTELRELIRADYSYRQRARSTDMRRSTDVCNTDVCSTDVCSTEPPDLDEADDLGDPSYREHYETHNSYAEIRGERMST
jgi:hypothetical protein